MFWALQIIPWYKTSKYSPHLNPFNKTLKLLLKGYVFPLYENQVGLLFWANFYNPTSDLCYKK